MMRLMKKARETQEDDGENIAANGEALSKQQGAPPRQRPAHKGIDLQAMDLLHCHAGTVHEKSSAP